MTLHRELMDVMWEQLQASHILIEITMLDPNVQIHKMFIEAFDRFDNLEQKCDVQNQNPLNNQPMENPPYDVNFQDDQQQHEI